MTTAFSEIFYSEVFSEVKSEHLPRSVTFEDVPPSRNCSIACIDGGFGEVFRSASRAVFLVRVYARCSSKRWRREEVVLVGIVAGGVSVRGARTLFFSGERSDDAVLKAVSAYQRLRELELALEVCKSEVFEVLIIDGSLDTFIPEEKVLMDNLAEECSKRSISVAGVCKSCSWTLGGFPLVSVLDEGADRPVWYSRMDGSYIVKFHERALTPFRVDIRGDVMRVLGALRWQSCDLASPGYPYCLVDADRFAQVSKREAVLSRVAFHARTGWKFESEEWSVKFHDMLNRIA